MGGRGGSSNMGVLTSNYSRYKRLGYKRLMQEPDSFDKLMALEYNLLRFQHHGSDFENARDEAMRLRGVYSKQYAAYIKRMTSRGR